ncbi:MAG: hypothetical protein M3071_05410, partial [Actinomycetota bacterium]|nr:hypothetical protein [Actinomycetota bacterium]
MEAAGGAHESAPIPPRQRGRPAQQIVDASLVKPSAVIAGDRVGQVAYQPREPRVPSDRRAR